MTREALRRKLDEIERQRKDDDFPGQTDEYRLQVILRAAVAAADELIMEGSDGSVEETEFLTSAVAAEFATKIRNSMIGRLTRKEICEQLEQRGAVLRAATSGNIVVANRQDDGSVEIKELTRD